MFADLKLFPLLYQPMFQEHLMMLEHCPFLYHQLPQFQFLNHQVLPKLGRNQAYQGNLMLHPEIVLDLVH